jgi:hypothetical protein
MVTAALLIVTSSALPGRAFGSQFVAVFHEPLTPPSQETRAACAAVKDKPARALIAKRVFVLVFISILGVGVFHLEVLISLKAAFYRIPKN